MEECAGALRAGSPHGVILGVEKGSASAPEPQGAEMSVLGGPQTTVTGGRVNAIYTFPSDGEAIVYYLFNF